MPAPGFAGFLREITPPPPPSFEQAFETSPEGFRCVFEDGTVAWLRPGPGQTTRLRILEGRRQRKAPVYVELDDDRAIVRLEFPRIGKPSRPREQPNGDLEFELFPSQCIHTLSSGNRDFAALRTALEQGRDQWLLVTGTDAHEIIHVAPVPPRDWGELDLPQDPGFLGQLAILAARWRLWFSDRTIALKATVTWPTEAQAQQLFDLVQAKSCATSSPAPDCLPFLYPDDGCKARAHKMCRLIEAAGFTPRKAWVIAPGTEKFSVATKNIPPPVCQVRWSHHVAPWLRVVTNAGVLAEYVIDPALFNGPALKTDWVATIGGSKAFVTSVRLWDYYYPSGSDMDLLDVTTNAELADMRDKFEQRVLVHGRPPYAGC